MRRVVRVIACIAVVMLLALATISCADIFGTQKQQPKVENKKPQKVPTPKPTAKPTPVPKKQVDVQQLIEQGKAQRRAGKYPAAIATLEDVLKVEPKQAEATRLLQEIKKERDDLVAAHIREGLKYNADDNLQAAMQEWNKALELDPGNKEALDYKERTQRKLDALKK